MHFGPVPEEIRACLHFMKLAEDHDERNIVVSYYARMSAIQLAMKVTPGAKSPEVSRYLMTIMDWLESTKKESAHVEGITNETVAQALLEEYMMKLYNYAYNCDCEGKFNKNMVKAYYTVSLLCEVLMQFGEISDDVQTKLNTSRYRATYLHNNLKKGVKPVPINVVHVSNDEEESKYAISLEELNRRRALRGEEPLTDERREPTEDELAAAKLKMDELKERGNPEFEAELKRMEDKIYNDDSFPVEHEIDLFPEQNPDDDGQEHTPVRIIDDVPTFPGMPTMPLVDVGPYNIDPTPVNTGNNQEVSNLLSSTSLVALNPEQTEKALKYCKWASSALNYDDMKTAVDNLEKALFLCKFGKEKP